MHSKGTVYDILAAFAASLVLLLSLLYVYFYPEFDATTLVVGVIFPLLFGCVVLAARRNWVFLFAFIAYFWSLVDDKPVQFDSVLTWPEVTRFNPAGPHIFMEIVLHALTIAFLYLAVREALKGTKLNASKALKVSVLTFVAFGFSYAQNIPLSAIQATVPDYWFPLDLLEHLASLAFLYFAVREAAKGPKKLAKALLVTDVLRASSSISLDAPVTPATVISPNS